MIYSECRKENKFEEKAKDGGQIDRSKQNLRKYESDKVLHS